MLPRLYTAISTRLPSPAALFSSTAIASSSEPSAFQRRTMAVQEFVDSTISNNKVAIFSKSFCPYCKKAKALFAQEFPDIKPTVVELDEREDGSEIQEYLHKKTGQRTVPNVFVATEHIGGNDDTQASFKAGKIAKLLGA